MRKVFLDDLPRRGKLIDWKSSVGCKVKFIYDDIEGEVLIYGYKFKNKLLLNYLNNSLYEISTINFKNCKIQGLLKEEILRPKYDENNSRRVDLRSVPLSSGGVDWHKVAENKMAIPFVYDDLSGEVQIIESGEAPRNR